MEKIIGTFTHLIYTNQESYHILSFQELDKKDNTVVVYPHSYKIPDCGTGEVVTCLGDWEEHPKYGEQFICHAHSSDVSSNDETEGMFTEDDGYAEALEGETMFPLQFCPHCGHEI